MDHGTMHWHGEIIQPGGEGTPYYAVFECAACGRKIAYCPNPPQIKVLELGTMPTAQHSGALGTSFTPDLLADLWGMETPEGLGGAVDLKLTDAELDTSGQM